jgi:two-component system, chemotaxis family, protein-glutamate methylesterase/glutaminase
LNNTTRVLVVDDSAFARASLTRMLSSDKTIEIIGQAHDGIEAIAMTAELKPDVVTLDVTMPNMDGITALGHIMTKYPTPVVMVSALTGEQTKATIEALELGAVDFFLKASNSGGAARDGTPAALIEKVKLASSTVASRLSRNGAAKRPARRRPTVSNGTRVGMKKVIVIGSSTGGPRALTQVMPFLPADLSATILVVQHMPEGFTKSMSERLDQMSEFSVKEASLNDRLEPGKAFVAPGDYHMTVSRDGVIDLNQGPPVWGVRPAVDITMESVARAYGGSTIGVILTGMGTDGTAGTGQIKAAGGKIAVEDESTCAVYGMPKSVVSAGNADHIVPISSIAETIIEMCSK